MKAVTITDWANAAHDLSRVNGWHEAGLGDHRVPEFVANLHGEVSELWEAWRAGRLHAPCDKANKMSAAGLPALTCAEEELADIVIRAFDNARALGVDIEHAIAVKHAFNATRPYRHGGKRA